MQTILVVWKSTVFTPGLMTVLVVGLKSAHGGGRYRLAHDLLRAARRRNDLPCVARVLFVSTLSERSASALSVLVDAILIWVSTVVAFAVWYWEIDAGGPDERISCLASS